MSDSVGNVLKYSRRWSRKDLKSISCISLSNSGNWLSAAQHSSLLIFHADNGTLAVKVECPTAISAMLWVSDIAVVCCTADGTIMTISLLQVRRFPPSFLLPWAQKSQKSIVIVGTVCRGHRVEQMTANCSNTYLATGWGKDIRIWRRRTTDGALK